MQWYVKLPENDKVAVLAFVQKGIYNKHIPSVAEDLYNIYLDESALAMWVEAQEMTEKHRMMQIRQQLTNFGNEWKVGSGQGCSFPRTLRKSMM